jgi:predicted transposase YbfD/YdcC
MNAIASLFGHLDPRRQNSQHDFCELMFIAIASTLCGAKNCSDMARFAQEKLAMLRQVLRLEHGPPSHDTFSALFRKLDPKAFAEAFGRFARAMAQAAGRNRQIAIDGKAMRGAFEAGASHAPRMLVSAWGREVRMTLAAQPAPGGSETKAALELLRLLDLEGAVVTADALHCSRAMAGEITRRGGDCCLALKGNQGPLLADAEKLLARSSGSPEAVSEDAAHGREETRSARVVTVPAAMGKRHDFPSLEAIGEISRTRMVKGRTQQDRCIYALSRALDARELLDVARGHWQIENALHWRLDVVYREDECRTRKDHGAENLALLRRIAINTLQADSKKDTMRGKIMRAGWNDSYLFQLMTHTR